MLYNVNFNSNHSFLQIGKTIGAGLATKGLAGAGIGVRVCVIASNTRITKIAKRFNSSTRIKSIVINLVAIFGVSLLSFIYPKFMFIAMLFGSGFVLLLTFPQYILFLFPQGNNTIIRKLILMFYHYGILNLLCQIHLRVFYTTWNELLLWVWGLNITTVLYSLCSRYLFIISFNGESLNSLSLLLIYISLFLGITALYMKFLINFSCIVIHKTRQVLPELLEPLLRVDPDDIPTPKGEENKKYSLFQIEKHQHNHNYPPKPKFTAWQKGTVIGGFATLIVSAGAVYYAKTQVDLARIQLEEMKQQTDNMRRQTEEMKRQNDLEALSQNLFDKTEYCRRQPTDCSTPPDNRAAQMEATKKSKSSWGYQGK